MSPRTVLNLECGLAVSVLLILLIVRGSRGMLSGPASSARWPIAFILLAVIAGFWPVLSMPLITDDYIHIQQVRTEAAPSPLGYLTHSCGGPRFFRPAGAAIYWAEWRLWGTAARPRHILDLVLHAASSVLFLLLVRRLGLPYPFDLLAALLFAWHGARPETVAWPGARFDALAVFFSLAAALAILAALRTGSRWARVVSLLATVAACLSKESAFVLPVLLALLLGRESLNKTGRRLILCAFAATGAVFLWRWLVLKGIGGYWEGNTGAPTVFQFHGITIVKTFLFRIWGVLWFPMNWSRSLELWMTLGLAAGVAASLLLLKARPGRARLGLCLLGVAVACLPTHHMLLIGPSLEQSRYLAYATPVFILALVFSYYTLPWRIGVAGLTLMVVFNAAALQHNLRIWRSVASARYEMCRNVATLARNSAVPVSIAGLPLTVDGVYWRNGFEECLELEFGIPPGKVLVNPLTPPEPALHLDWDAGARSLH